MDNIIGKKIWGVMRKDSTHPICVSEDREVAISSIDEQYIFLVELEVKSVNRMCVHFCDCCCKNHNK